LFTLYVIVTLYDLLLVPSLHSLTIPPYDCYVYTYTFVRLHWPIKFSIALLRRAGIRLRHAASDAPQPARGATTHAHVALPFATCLCTAALAWRCAPSRALVERRTAGIQRRSRGCGTRRALWFGWTAIPRTAPYGCARTYMHYFAAACGFDCCHACRRHLLCIRRSSSLFFAPFLLHHHSLRPFLFFCRRLLPTTPPCHLPLLPIQLPTAYRMPPALLSTYRLFTVFTYIQYDSSFISCKRMDRFGTIILRFRISYRTAASSRLTVYVRGQR